MQIGIIIYIVFMLVAGFSKLLPPYTLLFVSLMNVLSYWLYAQDKEAAQLGNRRIPEQTLHIVDSLGGWCGGWLAQQKLRHKTQKQPFRKIYFCTIFFHLLLILFFPFQVFLQSVLTKLASGAMPTSLSHNTVIASQRLCTY